MKNIQLDKMAASRRYTAEEALMVTKDVTIYKKF